MSETEQASDAEPSKVDTTVVPPPAPQAIGVQRRETLVATTLSALLVVDAVLIYILHVQLSHVAESTFDLAISVGILIVVAVISVTIVRVAVSRYKKPVETIPSEDRALLEELIRTENSKAIELYVRLSSLGGPTGTATKLGLTGLPLATIGLTIFFAIIALYQPTFLDLAKLTLGAFIGSFVQRSGEALERAVRATATPAPPTGPSPPNPPLQS